jgi:hypothetical protein
MPTPTLQQLRRRTERANNTLESLGAGTDSLVIGLPLLFAAVAGGMSLWFLSKALGGALVLSLASYLLGWAFALRVETSWLARVPVKALSHAERVNTALVWWRLSRLVGRFSMFLAGIALGVSIPAGANYLAGSPNDSLFASIMQCTGAACSLVALSLVSASRSAKFVSPLLLHLKSSESDSSKI